MHPLLEGYPVVIEQVVDWGDMDSYAHVNNVVYFRYFENARIEYFRHLDWLTHVKTTGLGPILASTQARFRRAVVFPATLLVGAKVTNRERDRFTLAHRIVNPATNEAVTEGESLVVSYDYRKGEKAAIPEEIVRRIEILEGRPI